MVINCSINNSFNWNICALVNKKGFSDLDFLELTKVIVALIIGYIIVKALLSLV
jgi:hypothetical protein